MYKNLYKNKYLSFRKVAFIESITLLKSSSAQVIFYIFLKLFKTIFLGLHIGDDK